LAFFSFGDRRRGKKDRTDTRKTGNVKSLDLPPKRKREETGLIGLEGVRSRFSFFYLLCWFEWEKEKKERGGEGRGGEP